MVGLIVRVTIILTMIVGIPLTAGGVYIAAQQAQAKSAAMQSSPVRVMISPAMGSALQGADGSIEQESSTNQVVNETSVENGRLLDSAARIEINY